MLNLILGLKLRGMTRIHFKPNITIFCLFSFITSFLSSCKEDTSPPIPDVPVYLELNLTNELANLGVGQIVTIIPDVTNEGFSIVDYHNTKFKKTRITWRTYGKGIVIYRKDLYDYQPFDLTCTYQAFKDYCAVSVDNRETLPQCPCCKSVFMLNFDGMPSTGSKAIKPLVKYLSSIENNGTMLIISK